MSLTEDLHKGMVIRHEGQLFTVLDYHVAQTGKQKPTVHVKLRAIKGGHPTEKTLEQLGKIEMTAFQASARGGVVRVRVNGDRILLGGQAVTVMKGSLL